MQERQPRGKAKAGLGELSNLTWGTAASGGGVGELHPLSLVQQAHLRSLSVYVFDTQSGSLLTPSYKLTFSNNIKIKQIIMMTIKMQ